MGCVSIVIIFILVHLDLGVAVGVTECGRIVIVTRGGGESFLSSADETRVRVEWEGKGVHWD